MSLAEAKHTMAVSSDPWGALRASLDELDDSPKRIMHKMKTILDEGLVTISAWLNHPNLKEKKKEVDILGMVMTAYFLHLENRLDKDQDKVLEAISKVESKLEKVNEIESKLENFNVNTFEDRFDDFCCGTDETIQMREQSINSVFDSSRNFLPNDMMDQPTPPHHQFFHLMSTQNCLILQQQQLMHLWLQQQHHTSHHQPIYCRNCESTLSVNNFSPPPLPLWNSPIGSNYPSGSQIAAGSRMPRNRVVPNANRHPESTESLSKIPPQARSSLYWDNFKSNHRQNQLNSNDNSRSGFGKGNENLVNGLPSQTANQSFNYNTVSQPKPTDQGAQKPFHYSNSSLVNKSSPFPQTARKTSYPGAHSDHSVGKIKNTPTADAHPARCSQSDFSVMASKMSKYMNMEKRDMKTIHAPMNTVLTQNRMKSSNISMSQTEEGAVGGEELTTNKYDADHLSQPSSSTSNRNHPIPLHIPPSTGAIRKKNRNPDVIESASSKPDKKDNLTSLLSETTRPLMAAEGRSSEIRPIVNGNANLPSAKNSQASLLLLRQRPPTTGATSSDENEESVSSSADDDLVEADQTTIEVIEPENIHSSNRVMQAIPVSNFCDSTGKPETKSGESENADLGDNAEDEDDISVRNPEDGGMRFSGDGEQ